jgi:DNA-binding XRE family transcriptional regulator
MTELDWGGPTVRRMLVGAQLRRLRADLGLSRAEAAEAIRASEWKIHRLETARSASRSATWSTC